MESNQQAIATETRQGPKHLRDLPRLLDWAARHGIAGGVAGLIGIGLLGLRGTMRLLTITSGGAGRLTENGNRAGDVTADGTIFLVMAGAVLGGMIGLAYGCIRRALPQNIWLKALLTAPFLARLLMLDPDNVDFARFGPSWVAVAGFTLGCLVYVFILERALRRLERVGRMPLWVRVVVGVPPLLLLAAGLPGLIGLDPGRVITIGVIAAVLFGWWRRATWLKVVPVALAALWIVGGIGWWLQGVIELV